MIRKLNKSKEQMIKNNIKLDVNFHSFIFEKNQQNYIEDLEKNINLDF